MFKIFSFSVFSVLPGSSRVSHAFRPLCFSRRRADLIMQLQAPIMDDFCQSFVGKTIRVLCVGYDEELQRCIGRSYADSPDIDGLVYFTGRCPEGEMTDVLISGADDGMLIGDEI